MNLVKSTLLIALLTQAVFWAACSQEAAPAGHVPETVHNLPVLALQRSDALDLLEAVGTVRAVQTAVLASQTMGNLVEVRAREGDRVQRGQILAVIDDSQPRAAFDRASAAEHAAQQQLTAADSDLKLANSTLERYQTLYERKSVSPQEFDEVKARQQTATARRDMARADKDQAGAGLAQSRSALEYTRIRAPFDGIVVEKRADPGTLASPGMPIFTVEDVRRFRLEAAINETDLPLLRLGQVVTVLADAIPNTELKSKVSEIVPAADPASRSFTVKIDLPPDPRLRSGLFGRAEIARGTKPSLKIPQAAVVERGQLQGVFVLNQDRVASLRYVTLGKRAGKEIEVLSGLADGDRIVASPGTFDLEGKRVEGQP